MMQIGILICNVFLLMFVFVEPVVNQSIYNGGHVPEKKQADGNKPAAGCTSGSRHCPRRNLPSRFNMNANTECVGAG